MADDSLLGQLAAEFTQRVRKGRRPDIDEYAGRYPELANRIRELFPTLLFLEGMAKTGDSPATGTSPLSPGSLFGNYRIEREVGRGGTGIVYEAIYVLLEKRVALKILPVRAPGDAPHLERFLREARTAAGLHHTNIVPLFDVGQVGDTPYFAMQYVEGRGLDLILGILQAPADSRRDAAPLPERAREPDPLSRGEGCVVRKFGDPWTRFCAGLPAEPRDYFCWVAEIGIQAAQGLAHAHERRVIHRNIKPSNLLLDKEEILWIVDFGLAPEIDSPAMTQSGAPSATFRYMSPEQAETARCPVDQRSDIYSLGATLYELLTCHPVFEGRTPQEVLSQILTREPMVPSKLNREIPAELATVVMKAMAKRPQDRYQSARDLAGDLQCWLKVESSKTRPIGPVGRMIRWCRRNLA